MSLRHPAQAGRGCAQDALLRGLPRREPGPYRTTRTSCRSRPPAAIASGATKPIPPARPGLNRSRSRSITVKSASSATCRISPPKPNENFLQPAQRPGQTGRPPGRRARPAGRPRGQGGGATGLCHHPRAQWLRPDQAQVAHGDGRQQVHRLRALRGVVQAGKRRAGGPYFRTWIERYVIPKPAPGSRQTRGEVQVDSPDGGIDGFPELRCPKDQIEFSFFVPKLCNFAPFRPASRSVRWGRRSRARRRGAD